MTDTAPTGDVALCDPDATPRNATIGVSQLTAYYVSNLIGAGIFVIPALAQQAAGPWALLAWGLMAVCAVPTAWVMGRIAIDYANDNGVLHFVRQVVSARLGAALSLLIVLIMVVGNPVMGLISARYALVTFGIDEGMLFPLAAGFMFLSILFNMLGLSTGARIQTALVAVAMVVLLALAGLSLGTAETLRPAPAPFDLSALFAAIGICFFAYLGWENVATIARDVARPERTFPLALVISVPVIGGTYLLVALALLLVSQDGAGLGGNVAVMDHLVAPFGDPRLQLAVNVLTLTVVVLSTNAWVLSASRLLSADTCRRSRSTSSRSRSAVVHRHV
ncbi:MAG: amino acid permease [Salinarimonas sp.]|nr:amino acid permease [Salinarimonas sp.]